MGAFLYFVPDAVGREKFLTGRATVFGGDAETVPRGVNAGPDGGPGTLIAVNPRAGKSAKAFIPDEQVWHRAPGRDWFFGWLKADPPSPEGLIRERPLPGHPVRLGDGKQWTIPVARFATGEIVLPKAMGLDESGTFGLRPLPEFSYLAAGAETFWQALTGGDELVQIEFEEFWPVVVEALRLNYRVGQEEASVLGLVTTTNIWEALRALIDWPTVEKFLKEQAAQKKTPETGGSSSSGSGVTDSPPATPPQSPTLNSTSTGDDAATDAKNAKNG